MVFFNMSEPDLTPEGFAELYELMCTGLPDREFRADEIQAYLSDKYNFSSGKVTGIIKRAKDKKMIVQKRRGGYSLNNDKNGLNRNTGIVESINDELEKALKNIELTVAKSLEDITDDDFVKIRNKIKQIKSIIDE